MSTPLYIVGAGGHGAVVAEIASACGLTIAGFIDDNPERTDTRVLSWSVLGGRACIPQSAMVALAIGNNITRGRLLDEAGRHDWRLPVLIHPSAVISPSATLGPGTVVMPQAVVNARAQVGSGCILNTACSVDHDCVIGVAVHIAPGARLAGQVTVGDGTLIGVGSCARPGVIVGAQVVVGVGSVLVSNLPAGVVAYGNPARAHGLVVTGSS